MNLDLVNLTNAAIDIRTKLNHNEAVIKCTHFSWY